MSKFKIYDGSTWCDPCTKNIHILKSDDTFQLLDVENQNVNYYDGTTWKKIVCGLQCGDSIETSGGSGVYYIKFLKNQGFNKITIAFNALNIPDCLQLLNESKTELLKSSSYVGLGAAPPTGLYSIPEYLYDNSTNTFLATGNNESYILYNASTYPTYSVAIIYNLGDVVTYNDFVYECVVPFSIANTPDTSSDWLNISIDKAFLPFPKLPGAYSFVYYDNTLDEKTFWLRTLGNPVSSGTVWEINSITCENVISWY
jgi:hypothetical protein